MSEDHFTLYREWYKLVREGGKSEALLYNLVHEGAFPLPPPPSACTLVLKHVPREPWFPWLIPPPVSMGPGVLSIARDDEGKARLKVYNTDPKADAVNITYTKEIHLKMLFYLAAVELMNEDVDVASCYDGETRRQLRALIDQAKEIVRKWWERWWM